VRDDEIGADRPRAGEAGLHGADRMSAPRTNERRTVRDIAHARAGDKGNISNVNVWVHDPADFELLKRTLTPERIKREFPNLVQGKVERYVVEHLHGINIVMRDALEGGVNSSLNLDSHGKSWSYLILGLTLDEN
jgi:hypothetical protein